MFNSLTGTITGKSTGALFIDTHGIEWSVTAPQSTLDALPAVGERARVFTCLVHNENTMELYGFASAAERALYLDLLKVDGIGPKGAVKILSNISGEDLVAALDDGDVGRIEKVPGVGKKTAAKMLLALKGKLSLVAGASAPQRRTEAQPFAAVIDSLASMGYDRRDCEQTVAEVSSALAKEAGWEKKKPTEREDAVFRQSLVEMSR